MSLVLPGLRRIASPASNAWLLDTGDGLVLVDTGVTGVGPFVARAVSRAIASAPLRAIALTHAHADHAGGLATVATRNPGVPVVAGPADVPAVRRGGVPPAPLPTGPVGRLILIPSGLIRISAWPAVEPIADGASVPGTPGLVAIAAPGHTPGHTVYRWPGSGGILFAGDAAVTLFGLRRSFVHADPALAAQTLARLAELDFEVAVFGHGGPIRSGAATRIRRLVAREAAAADRARGTHA